MREGHRTSPCVLSARRATSAASSCPRSSRASSRSSAGTPLGSMAMERRLVLDELGGRQFGHPLTIPNACSPPLLASLTGGGQREGSAPFRQRFVSAAPSRSGPTPMGRPVDLRFRWWRGKDLNLRPSGYEPDELPDCSTPRTKVTRGLLTCGSASSAGLCPLCDDGAMDLIDRYEEAAGGFTTDSTPSPTISGRTRRRAPTGTCASSSTT